MSIPAATSREWAALGLLGTVLVLSALCQFRSPIENYIRSWDLFCWLPFWNFFAPQPGVLDLYLLFRDELTDGSLTGWRELSLIRERSWYNFLWNRDRRIKKALFDSAVGMMKGAQQGGDIRISVPYILLLTYISGRPRLYHAVKTQFLLMASSPAAPDEEPEALAISDLHPL
jgi:hypothetical protein